MKIDSMPEPIPRFKPVRVTIVLESQHEMEALQNLCETGGSFGTRPQFKKEIEHFFETLRPHVTGL